MERSTTPDAMRRSLSDRIESLFSAKSLSNANATSIPSSAIMDGSACAAQQAIQGVSLPRRLRLPSSPMPAVPLIRYPCRTSPRAEHDPVDFSASSSSRPPTPVVVALSEALSESILPCPPPLARLPPVFSPSRSLSRLSRPPLLETVRSTHPTASLSVAHSSFSLSDPSCRPPTPLSPTFGRPISPPCSSLDVLRSIHTSTSVQLTAAQSLSRRWFQSDPDSAKERVASVLDEEDAKADLTKKFRAPKAPLVFCHGLLGFDSVTIGPAIAPLQVPHWRGIKEVLEESGCEVLITRVPATSSPGDRAKVLERKISETYPGRTVHLIGHSMGGLDCRYLITHLTQRSFQVLSLTTIATPHRGSTFATHFLSLASTRLPAVLALLELLPNGGGDGKAFEALTPEAMEEFNTNTLDMEGVRYFSWGAEYEPGLFDAFKYPHSIIYAKEGSNDGLVSVWSARWGTYLGTLKDVNHLDLVGWTDGIASGLGLPSLGLKGMAAAVRGKEVGFSPGRFYLGVADLLAGVEEEEGYVKDGAWVGSRDNGAPDESQTQEATVLEGGATIRRTSSDKARARMEEVLRRTPSSPSTPTEESCSEDNGPQSTGTKEGDAETVSSVSRNCSAFSGTANNDQKSTSDGVNETPALLPPRTNSS